MAVEAVGTSAASQSQQQELPPRQQQKLHPTPPGPSEVDQDGGADLMSTMELSVHLRALQPMDGGGGVVRREELQHIKRVGEGGFALVDLYWYHPGKYDKRGGYSPASKEAPKIVVAAKSPKPAVFEEQSDLDCFLQEALIMSRISHPYIVSCYGLCRPQGSGEGSGEPGPQGGVLVVQEYMAAGTLKRMVLRRQIAGKGVYRLTDALRWCTQVAQALHHLHSAKPQIIHRDLKLENVLLKGPHPSSMTAKVADFGLAACIDTWRGSRQQRQQEGGAAPSVTAAAAAAGGDSSGPSAPPPSPLRRLSSASLSSSSHPEEPPSPPTASRGPPSAGSPSSSFTTPTHLGHSTEAAFHRSPSSDTSSSFTGGASPSPSPSAPRPRSFTSMAAQAVLKAASPAPTPSDVYLLTGRTGSLMYMAPEVFRGEAYDAKVDVFSFALVMLEVFIGHVLSTSLAPSGTTAEVESIAHRMAHDAFRPYVPGAVPTPIADLIRSCWAHDPAARPDMGRVVGVLKEVGESGLMAAIDKARRQKHIPGLHLFASPGK